MTYRTLLTHVPSDRRFRSHLPQTVEVAKALQLDVIGLGARAPRPFGSDGAEAPPAGGGADLKFAEALFRQAVSLEPTLRARWRAQLGYPGKVTPGQSRAADLVVAYRHGGRDASVYAQADDLVMTCGAPVLLLPGDSSAFRCDRILVAWKNTREARSAVSAALPLLKLADKVLVFTAREDGRMEQAEIEVADVCERLRKHGVRHASGIAEPAYDEPVGRRLVSMAQADDTDLIVAGACGRSRLREWDLGATTQDLLDDGRHYVLLNH